MIHLPPHPGRPRPPLQPSPPLRLALALAPPAPLSPPRGEGKRIRGEDVHYIASEILPCHDRLRRQRRLAHIRADKARAFLEPGLRRRGAPQRLPLRIAERPA